MTKKYFALSAAALFILIILFWGWLNSDTNPAPSPPVHYRLKSLPEVVATIAHPTPQIKAAEQNSEQAKASPEAIDLKAIIRRGDPCELMRAMQKWPADGYEIASEEIARRKDLVDHTPADDESFEAVLTGVSGSSQSEILKFYNALLAANLLEGAPKHEIDLREADSLLSELESEDPDNGAFPYFLAAVRQKNGAPENEITDQVRLAFNAPKFNTFTLEISQHIWERGLQDPLGVLLARMMLALMPIPDYNDPYHLAKATLEQNKDFAPAALGFGQRLEAPGVNYGVDRDELIWWLALEHAVGRSLYLQAWAILHPNETPDPIYNASFKDFMKQKKVDADDHFFEGSTIYQKVLVDKDYCPREQIDEIFKREQQKFLDFKNQPSK